MTNDTLDRHAVTRVRHETRRSSLTITSDNRVQQVAIKTGAREGGHVELISGPPLGSWVLLGSSAFCQATRSIRSSIRLK